MVDGDPLLDLGTMVKPHIVPNNHIDSMLCLAMIPELTFKQEILKTTQEREEVFSVIRPQGVMVVENPSVIDGHTKGHTASMLTRDFHDGQLCSFQAFSFSSH